MPYMADFFHAYLHIYTHMYPEGGGGRGVYQFFEDRWDPYRCYHTSTYDFAKAPLSVIPTTQIALTAPN